MRAREFYIWSIEHNAWWGPASWGYAPTVQQAGRYTAEEAEAIVRRANIVAFHECAIPVEALAIAAKS